jgi:hypothetical protein
MDNNMESEIIAYEDGQQLIIKEYTRRIDKIKLLLNPLLIREKDLLEEKQIMINLDFHNGRMNWEKQHRAEFNSISGKIAAFKEALEILS